MAKRYRVVRLITRLNIGGPAIHTILLTAGLDRRRFASYLVAGREAASEGNMLPLAERTGVRPISVPELGRAVRPGQDLIAFGKVVRLLQRSRPAVVHTHMAKAGAVGRLAARLTGVPVVVHTYHGHVFHSYFNSLTTAAFLSAERMLARLSDRLIAVGEEQRQEIAHYGIGGARQLVAVPLGLELDPFLADTPRGALRAELGVPPDVPLAGIVARLVPVKAHETFLEAAAELRRGHPTARFVIVGDGERRAALEAQAGALGLGDAVHFLGWRHDLASVYADLDVVCLTSLNEGSPVALIEAMAAARPVVATAVGGVPEVVRDGASGYLVPPRDPVALAARIAEVLAAPETARRLGLAARDAVYPKYTIGRLIGDLETLYLDLLTEKGAA
jgi:glycosyltransferase involved in cell wall biosynthesis